MSGLQHTTIIPTAPKQRMSIRSRECLPRDRPRLASTSSNISTRLFGVAGCNGGAESPAPTEDARREGAAVARLMLRLQARVHLGQLELPSVCSRSRLLWRSLSSFDPVTAGSADSVRDLASELQEVTTEGLGDCHDGGPDGVREAALQLLARIFAESVPDQVCTFNLDAHAVRHVASGQLPVAGGSYYLAKAGM